MPQRDEGYLLDMLEMARRALRHVEGIDRSQFDRDEVLQDALIRVIQVFGEAARRVSVECREAHPDIPWSKIVGMRNKLVHDYIESIRTRSGESSGRTSPSFCLSSNGSRPRPPGSRSPYRTSGRYLIRCGWSASEPRRRWRSTS